MGEIRWIDLDSQEFKAIEYHHDLRQSIMDALKDGELRVDAHGYLWKADLPLHTKIGEETVRLRYSGKAAN